MSSEPAYNQPVPLPPHVLAGAPPPASARQYDSYAVPLAKVAPEPDIRTFQHTSIYDTPAPLAKQPALTHRRPNYLLWGILFFPLTAMFGGSATAYVAFMLTQSFLGWAAFILGGMVGLLVAGGFAVAGLVSSVRGLQNGGRPSSAGRTIAGVVGILINSGLLLLILQFFYFPLQMLFSAFGY